MQKKLALLLLIIILSSNFHLPILAQEEEKVAKEDEGVYENKEIERARKDYLFQFDKYIDTHQEYVITRNTYHQYKTISSQQEAVVKAREVLATRAEALRAYLQLLKIFLNFQQVLDPALQKSQFGKIEATQSFLVNHQNNSKEASSVSEVNSESSRLEREAQAIYELSYETLSIILIGNMQNLELRTRSLLASVERSPSLPEGKEIEEGISEVKRRLTTVRISIDQANQILQDYQFTTSKKRGTGEGAYRTIQIQAEKTKTLLKEAETFIQELERKMQDE